MKLFETNESRIDQITAELETGRVATRREIARQVAATDALAGAEATYAGALAADALKADAAGVQRSREAVAGRRAELDEQGARLVAVRTHLWRLATNSALEVGAMSTEPLDREAARALETFAIEWETAAQAFGQVMARRQALEGLLVRKLHLPAPTPGGTSDVTGLMPLCDKLTAFRASLDAASAVPGPSVLEGGEADLFRAFVTAHQTYRKAEWARFDKIRRANR